jgi:hypothetical protein
VSHLKLEYPLFFEVKNPKKPTLSELKGPGADDVYHHFLLVSNLNPLAFFHSSKNTHTAALRHS